MKYGVELICEKVPIGANLLNNAENDNSFRSKYVKSHFKLLLSKTFFRFNAWKYVFQGPNVRILLHLPEQMMTFEALKNIFPRVLSEKRLLQKVLKMPFYERSLERIKIFCVFK